MEERRNDESSALFRSEPRYSPIASLFAAQCLGVSCRGLGLRPDVWLGLGAVAWLAWLVVSTIDSERRTRWGLCSKHWLLLAAVASWMAGYATSDWAWRRSDNLSRRIEDGAPICVEAVVLRGPVLVLGGRVRALVRILRVRDGCEWRGATGVSQLRMGEAESQPHLWRGQRIRIVGRASLPPRAANPGEFDIAARCRNQGVDLLLDASPTNVRVLRAAPRWRPSVNAWRRSAAAAVVRCISPQQRGVALALIVGERTAMSREERDRFVALGVMHLLAISGLHVGMVIACFWQGAKLGWLGRTTQLAGGLALAVGFALFTGAQPPVLRATLFLGVIVLGRWRSRETDSLTIICSAGAAILLLDPSHLFETGVHLSFLAVVVLCRFAQSASNRGPQDPLDRLIYFSRPLPIRWLISGVRNAISLLWVSTWVYVVLAPLTMSTFHVVTPYAPLLNLILTPLTAVALLSGFAAVCLELTIGQGAWIGWLCELAIGAIRLVLSRFEGLPAATHWTAGPPRWWAPWIYGLMAMWLLPWASPFPVRSPPAQSSHGSWPRWLYGRWSYGKLAGGAVTAAIGLGLVAADRPDESGLRCTILSVGHGACVVLQTPEGRTILYDAGSLGRAEFGARQISQALWAARVRSIDAIVVSHADQDHFNCVALLARRIPVRKLYATRGFYSHPDTAPLQRELRAEGVAFAQANDGARLPVDSAVDFRFLHPQNSRTTSDNAQSLLLEVAFAGQTILLTGDLEREGMAALLARPPRIADIALAPHHGSRHSDPAAFLAWARPHWVIASTGRGRSLQTLSTAASAVNCRMLSTAQSGAVRVAIDGNGCRVDHWMGTGWAAIGRNSIDGNAGEPGERNAGYRRSRAAAIQPRNARPISRPRGALLRCSVVERIDPCAISPDSIEVLSMPSCVLAYSGGLDTSVILGWLQDEGYEVHAVYVDLGQPCEDRDAILQKAKDIGAASARIIDVQEELCRDFAFPVLQWQAKYESIYLLGTSIARPLISKVCLQVAREVGADAYAHGATGKGNDQCRFQLAAEALDPSIELIAPWRNEKFRKVFPGRTELINYCEERNIPVKVTASKPYSSDENCLHISYEAGQLEELNVNGVELVDFGMGVSPQDAPDQVETVSVDFESGVPVAVNGEKMSPLQIVKTLNEIGGRNGVGRIDMVENRFVGMKSRGVYEAPGMTLLYDALLVLEQLTMDRDLTHLRDRMAPEVAEMVYYGYWYCAKFDALLAFIREAQKHVTGSVRLQLYKGNIMVDGRQSPNSLYDEGIATMEGGGSYNQDDAEGFLRIQGLPYRVQGRVTPREY